VTVTLKDIAAKCGLSPSTVSDVLNARSRTWASAETRDRVYAAARELGYKPNTAARALRSGKTHAVAFVYCLDAPDSRMTYDSAAEIMADALSNYGYHLRLHVYPGQTPLMQGLEDLVRGKTCDAYVLFGREPDVAVQGTYLEEHGAPFVVKGRHERQFPHWPQVDYDHEAMMERVVDHLTERGHRRIAYLGYTADEAFSHYLKQGFCAAMLARFGEMPDERFIGAVGDRVDSAYYLDRWLALPSSDQPTALALGAGDHVWYAAEEALARVGRVIGNGPGQFAVAGQATHALLLAFGQGFYFEDISFQSIAETAVTDLLLPLLDGQSPAQPIRRILPTLRPAPSRDLGRYCRFRRYDPDS
jgi:LacI family transcriptional regulator